MSKRKFIGTSTEMNDTEVGIRDPVQLKIIIMAVVGLIFIYVRFLQPGQQAGKGDFFK